MAIRTAPIRLRWDTQQFLKILLALCITGWALLLVVAHSTGSVTTPRAAILLAFPIVALGVALRPAWVVLLLVSVPLTQIEAVPTRSQVEAVPTRGLVLLLVVTLGAQLVMQGRLSVGWRSGFIGLALLLVASSLLRIELPLGEALVARGILNDLAFYLLLGLVTYNATRAGALQADHFVNAILLGITLGVAVDMVFQSGAAGSEITPVGRPVAYLASAGFSICFARLISRKPDGSIYHPILHAILGCGFLVVMIPGLLRGAWLSALISVLLVSSWSSRKRYWVLIGLALVAILSVPVARERVIPTDEPGSGGGFTTGRLELWTRLWDEIAPGMPWGNGFGHSVTLDSEELFGAGSTDFVKVEERNTFVYPHNDFIFWMVELGVIGLFGMLLFWAQLIRASRRALRSTSRDHVILVGGVLVAGFISQLVGTTFFFRPLATPFFAVAGFVFALRPSSTT